MFYKKRYIQLEEKYSKLEDTYLQIIESYNRYKELMFKNDELHDEIVKDLENRIEIYVERLSILGSLIPKFFNFLKANKMYFRSVDSAAKLQVILDDLDSIMKSKILKK